MGKLVPIATFVSLLLATPGVSAEQQLFLAYPPHSHRTTSHAIFLIGTAPPGGVVLVNGIPLERHSAGHFAPSFPLKLGENQFILRYGDQEIKATVTRLSQAPTPPQGFNFGPDSLTPAQDLARLPGELICFGAIAPKQATVTVQLGAETMPLFPQPPVATLPPNMAVLTQENAPQAVEGVTQYQGCLTPTTPGDRGYPLFQLMGDGLTHQERGSGRITVLPPAQLPVVAVTADQGVARTGPGTDYSRLTPLPQGTRAAVTGKTGDWLRLDYGGWIHQGETLGLPGAVPPKSWIRSLQTRTVPGWTEVWFPLQVPVPVTVQQGNACEGADCQLRLLSLTLHNTVAQTDTIFHRDALIERLDWEQVGPETVEYHFLLRSSRQWGYKLRYEGTQLVLSLRQPPMTEAGGLPLRGVTILLDPGHGSDADLGARGPTGYPEKDVTLKVAQLIQTELRQRGATVQMTRTGDEDLYPQDRVDLINQMEPTLALSLHYNALPDHGDALNTQGIGAFWYQPQAHGLAVFLHDYLVRYLRRPSYGIFWNNLALTRPSVAPAVLLELGFMINPQEFEWIINAKAQEQIAVTLANGLAAWLNPDHD